MFQTNYNAINASIAFVLNVFKNLSNAHSDALIVIISFLCQKLLSEIQIKCVCGEILKYDIILKHKTEDCKINDVKKKNEFKKRYELEKQKLCKIKILLFQILNYYIEEVELMIIHMMFLFMHHMRL